MIKELTKPLKDENPSEVVKDGVFSFFPLSGPNRIKDRSLIQLFSSTAELPKISSGTNFTHQYSTEKPAPTSAGSRNLLLLNSVPLFPARILDWPDSDQQRISDAAYDVANGLPLLLQARWESYHPSEGEDSNAPGDEVEKPEEVPGGDQKGVDSNPEPESEVNMDLDQASDVAAQEATKAVKETQNQAAHVESAVEDGQAPLSAAADAEKAMDPVEALKQPFSMEGISTLNRNSAMRKRSVPRFRIQSAGRSADPGPVIKPCPLVRAAGDAQFGGIGKQVTDRAVWGGVEDSPAL